MRRTVQVLAVCGLLLVPALVARAGGDETAAIINKAMKAHYPKGLPPKEYGVRIKSKGKLHIMGMDLDISQELAIQVPTKFKEVMVLDLQGKEVPVTTVFNGKQGWIKAGDKDVKLSKEILAELNEVGYVMSVTQGLHLKDKSLKLSLLGESRVNDRPAVGLKISKVGKKDINIYFDKATGLTAKVETRKIDQATGQEVTEERIITEYQVKGGRKVAKKVEVKRDGQPLAEVEVLDVEFVDRLDDSEFTKPE
jgi:hypothetical protein